MNRFFIRRLVAGSLVLVIVMALGATFFFRWLSTQGEPGGPPVKVAIENGSSGSAIAARLEKEGVIHSAFAFRLFLKTRGSPSGLKAGEYQLHANMPFPELVAELQKGPEIEFVRLVIPEGLNVDQTAAQVDKLTHISAGDFLAAANPNTVRPSILPQGANTLEGFLYPTTYFIEEDNDPISVVKQLVAQFEKQLADQDMNKAQALGRSPYEILIIASMIEEEAKADEERTKISSVIHNRLRRNIALGIDATIQYAVKKYEGQPLTRSDLEINSPFNTRTRTGLPPTPISSPRASSINAALNPAEGDYLFYVLGPDCIHHVFTDNNAEFLRAKARQPRNC